MKVRLHACDRYCSTQILKNQLDHLLPLSSLPVDPPRVWHLWHLMEERPFPVLLLRWDVSSPVAAGFWRGRCKLTLHLWMIPFKTLFSVRSGRSFSCCRDILRARLMPRLPQTQVGEGPGRLPGSFHVFAEIACWSEDTDAGNACPGGHDAVRSCVFTLFFGFICPSSVR